MESKGHSTGANSWKHFYGGRRVTGNKHSLCAGKTGRWQQMKVLHVEEVADHNGPELCAPGRWMRTTV